jgi:RNA polymerase sigma-B factor
MAAISSGTIPAAESGLGSLVPPAWMPENLTLMDDGALLDIVRLSARASGRRSAACEVLISRHQGLVRSCVRRYMNSSESPEDLMQVGYVGLLKAISNYDPVFCRSLATYARPCISGELKRHFRDKRWQVHVKRPVQELVLEVREATWRLAQELGRMPADSDLTWHLGISGDDLRHARRADAAFQSHSLDAPLADGRGKSILADFLGAEDPGLEHMLSMQAVAAHWGELSPREQEILLMRFRGGMTQVQIGERLGISQMHVSRLLTRALGYLRSHLLDLEARLAHRKGPGIAWPWVTGRRDRERLARTIGALGEGLWTARVNAHSTVRAGDRIEVAVDTGNLHFFDPGSGPGITGKQPGRQDERNSR